MPATLLDVIGIKPGRERGVVRRGLSMRFDVDGAELPAVDPTGGRWGAGIIRGASLMATGEALGHGRYVDAESIRQTVDLGNASESGVKVRFTHPGMSSDGFGSFLGRAVDLDVSDDGTQAIGDIHFAKSSRRTPDGDRGGYVLEMAKESPDAFGMSIVFDVDREAESNFVADNSAADDDGDQVFESPDEGNAKNFPHVRLAKLHGADFVDEPAANATGVFHSGPSVEILDQAETLIEYALGISDEAPNLESTGGVSADRLRGYLSRFLDDRGLALKLFQEAPEMADDATTDTGTDTGNDAVDDAAANDAADVSTNDAGDGDTGDAGDAGDDTSDADDGAPVAELSIADLNKFREKFGDANAAKYLSEGVTFENALSLELDAVRVALEMKTGNRGEDDAVDEFTDGKPKKSNGDGAGIPIRFVTATPMAVPGGDES